MPSRRFAAAPAAGALLAILALHGALPAPAGAESAAAHVPKPLQIEADLSEERLELSILVDAFLLRHWTGIEAGALLDLGEEEFAAKRESLARFLAAHAPVAIDGIDVRPVVEDIELQEPVPETDFAEFAAVYVAYGVKGRPAAIEFTWSRFDTEDSYPLERVFLIFSTEDDFRVLELREDDPSRLWRRIGAPPAVDPEGVPPGIPRPRGRLPLASVVIAGAATAEAVRRWRRRMRPLRVISIIVIGGAAALAAAPLGVIEFRLPGDAAVELPDEGTARALFETLHRNIYRAFDYADEGQVYDALERSLAPELIDSVYGEVYRSLRMQLEQDEVAACTIRSVRVLEAAPELPPAPREPAFDIVAKWEVIGTVRHWGHGHWRTNRYTARYRVRWDAADGWRIGAVEILGQERVDDGREESL